jgi:hypothetical protein
MKMEGLAGCWVQPRRLGDAMMLMLLLLCALLLLFHALHAEMIEVLQMQGGVVHIAMPSWEIGNRLQTADCCGFLIDDC